MIGGDSHLETVFTQLLGWQQDSGVVLQDINHWFPVFEDIDELTDGLK